MSRRMRDLLTAELGAVRHEPIDKRIRGRLGDRTVVDSRRAVLVWEPRRIVPAYAVPEDDVDAEVVAGGGAADEPPPGVTVPRLEGRPVLDPSVPFAFHTAPGEPVRLRARDGAGEVAGFRLRDDALDGHLLVDFAGLDWLEEDEPNVAHPRDPFHRIDIVHSSRHVRVALGDVVLAESSRPYLLFEPPLPVRAYLSREDVDLGLLAPSDTVSWCAYKGRASYLSAAGAPDVAWVYEAPLREAAEVAGRVAFFDEHVDMTVDGRRLQRPVTPWSRPPAPPG
ncbi:DUF427 domain-containing protein [Baekduia soli]|uniref:DUF427 domain-containing protein n=1 Tax=Baekduia soli TaxID=496014 RepID=A0A5B8U3U3_9ACTN|nr:DUF427 domain-containing protein [Baekduia soli]QEC47558.1 DUF427 domain-containing protein [Baekduia soli]